MKTNHVVTKVNEIDFVYQGADHKCLTCGTRFHNVVNNFCPSCGTEIIASFEANGSPIVTHTVVSQFDDATVYHIFRTAYKYAEKKEIFYPETYNLKMRVFRDSGKVQVIANKRLLTSSTDLSLALKAFSQLGLVRMDLQDYYLANNSRLKDLCEFIVLDEQFYTGRASSYLVSPFDIQCLTFFRDLDKNARSRIYYSYDKKGTKEARQAIIGVANKNLVNFAWRNLSSVNAIRSLLKEYPADKLANAFKDKDSHFVNAVNSLFVLGYSFTKAVNMLNKFAGPTRNLRFLAQQLVDTVDMLQKIVSDFDAEYKMPQGSILELHDIVMRDFRTYTDLVKNNTVFPKANHQDYSFEGGIIEAAKRGEDLIKCGANMNICVGIYIDRVVRGDCQIFILKNTEGKELVCIEVKGTNIVQARLKNNADLSDKPELYDTVVEWSELNKLKIQSYVSYGDADGNDDFVGFPF